MKSHYRSIIDLTERMVPGILSEQDLDPDSRDFGGRVSADRGYSEPGSSAHAVALLASLVCCPESRWYRSDELTARAAMYADHLLRAQHRDGTLDLRETNFHDATMVGFSVQQLGYTWRLLADRRDASEDLDRLRESVHTFLVRGAEGMLRGGFHTPNHRWVMASGLSLLSTILQRTDLADEAGRYLREGIDCTEAGEYTERSAGIYNVTNNRSLIIIAEELSRPDLLDHVRRNLTMMMNYFEPDGSVFTLNSKRQDAGRTTFPVNYYENYLLMAHRDQSEIWAGAADSLLELATERRVAAGEVGSVLAHYILRSELRETELETAALPSTYTFENIDSGIVRLRNGTVSLSLLSDHTVFLQFRTGALAVAAKIAGTFYGEKGRFVPASIRRTKDGYLLESSVRWGYTRPLADPVATAEESATTDWQRLPHAEREHVMMSDFNVTVRVHFTGRAAELDIAMDGTDGVLVKLELLLSPGGWLDTNTLRLAGSPGHSAVLKDGSATYRLGPDTVTIAGGFAEHNLTTAMRGSEPPEAGVFTLFCTGYTPLAQTVVLSGGGPAIRDASSLPARRAP